MKRGNNKESVKHLKERRYYKLSMDRSQGPGDKCGYCFFWSQFNPPFNGGVCRPQRRYRKKKDLACIFFEEIATAVGVNAAQSR